MCLTVTRHSDVSVNDRHHILQGLKSLKRLELTLISILRSTDIKLQSSPYVLQIASYHFNYLFSQDIYDGLTHPSELRSEQWLGRLHWTQILLLIMYVYSWKRRKCVHVLLLFYDFFIFDPIGLDKLGPFIIALLYVCSVIYLLQNWAIWIVDIGSMGLWHVASGFMQTSCANRPAIQRMNITSERRSVS